MAPISSCVSKITNYVHLTQVQDTRCFLLHCQVHSQCICTASFTSTCGCWILDQDWPPNCLWCHKSCCRPVKSNQICSEQRKITLSPINVKTALVSDSAHHSMEWSSNMQLEEQEGKQFLLFLQFLHTDIIMALCEICVMLFQPKEGLCNISSCSTCFCYLMTELASEVLTLLLVLPLSSRQEPHCLTQLYVIIFQHQFPDNSLNHVTVTIGCTFNLTY